jgi:hypothetical protein
MLSGSQIFCVIIFLFWTPSTGAPTSTLMCRQLLRRLFHEYRDCAEHALSSSQDVLAQRSGQPRTAVSSTATMISSMTVGIMLSVNLQLGNATMLDNAKPDQTIAEI